MRDHITPSSTEGPDAQRTSRLRAVLAAHGFASSGHSQDIADALELGASALGGELVSAETVAACEAHTARCFFIRRGADGRASGFISLLYLNDAGYQALMYGRFRPEAPDLDHLAQVNERALAIYVWCLAGRGLEDKRAVVRAVTEARREAFPDIALFARPVSREGRMMTAALDAPSAGSAWLGWVPAAPPDRQGG
ncbi:MAG: hypothetical protein JJU18_09610 [Oceanicaulis sp.]|nr:hypothetical protein [Oceanicaulis sp.]